METGTIKKLLIAIAAVLAVVAVSYLIGLRTGQNKAAEPLEEKVDTLVILDTIVSYKPVIEERVVIQEVLVPVVRTDTIWKHDTLYVPMERVQIAWRDSLSLIYASGIMPEIDSVWHYVSEKVVTREVTKVVSKPCRWGIGIHAGYGVQFGEQIRTAPYVGVGLSYNILSW